MKITSKIQKLVSTYVLTDGFYVEVSGCDGIAEFHLGHRDYSIKVLMFECRIEPAEYESMILANIDAAIDGYREEYMDGEE